MIAHVYRLCRALLIANKCLNIYCLMTINSIDRRIRIRFIYIRINRRVVQVSATTIIHISLSYLVSCSTFASTTYCLTIKFSALNICRLCIEQVSVSIDKGFYCNFNDKLTAMQVEIVNASRIWFIDAIIINYCSIVICCVS